MCFGKSFIKFCKSFINLISSLIHGHAALPGLDLVVKGQSLVIFIRAWFPDFHWASCGDIRTAAPATVTECLSAAKVVLWHGKAQLPPHVSTRDVTLPGISPAAELRLKYWSMLANMTFRNGTVHRMLIASRFSEQEGWSICTCILEPTVRTRCLSIGSARAEVID